MKMADLYLLIRRQYPLEKGGFRFFRLPIRERKCVYDIRRQYPHPLIDHICHPHRHADTADFNVVMVNSHLQEGICIRVPIYF
uniref:Uncharacterized protein n=1 Tax=Romanomermis culicivorax TaxID=13658 RepID=A0A915L0G2_ROMCU